MAFISFDRPTGNESVADLCNMIAKLQKMVEFLAGNISDENVSRLGNWLAEGDRLVSEDGDVGMSGTETGSPKDVRFWAGGTDPATANWNVTKDGVMSATGANIRSSAGFPMIVMDPTGQLFAAYTAPDTYVGITPNYLGNGPGFIAVRNGQTEGGSYTTSFKYHLVAVNGLKLESGEDIELDPNGPNGVVISNWSRLWSNGAAGGMGQSLQGELNAKADASAMAAALAAKADASALAGKANSGSSTSSAGAGFYNGGIPPGTSLMVAGGGTVTWAGISTFSHSHTI